jgi:uncharacterized protein YjfI (DUF2170 family)
MTNQEKLQELNIALNGVTTSNDLVLSAEIVTGEVDVLIITIEDREEFPIYITVDDSQILCISHIWTEEEVIPEKSVALLDAMLTMNIPMPLSSFSKVGNQHIIFGALHNRSSIDEIIEEIAVLSDNTLTAVEEFSEFLI